MAGDKCGGGGAGGVGDGRCGARRNNLGAGETHVGSGLGPDAALRCACPRSRIGKAEIRAHFGRGLGGVKFTFARLCLR